MQNFIKLLRVRSFTHRAYTLMELVVAGIIMSVIAMVALPSFSGMMEKQYCKTAQMNLAAISSAAKIYHIKHRTYHTPNFNLTGINDDLGLQIDDPKFTYFWSGSAVDYTALAVRTGGPTYNCFFNYALPVGSTNPSCNSVQYCGTNYIDR